MEKVKVYLNTSSSPLAEGSRKVVAYLLQDTTHDYAADEDTLKITRLASKISVSAPSSIELGSSGYIQVTLKEDKLISPSALKYVYVTVKANGSQIKRNKTDGNGNLNFYWTPSSMGSFTISATFDGSTIYASDADTDGCAVKDTTNPSRRLSELPQRQEFEHEHATDVLLECGLGWVRNRSEVLRVRTGEVLAAHLVELLLRPDRLRDLVHAFLVARTDEAEVPMARARSRLEQQQGIVVGLARAHGQVDIQRGNVRRRFRRTGRSPRPDSRRMRTAMPNMVARWNVGEAVRSGADHSKATGHRGHPSLDTAPGTATPGRPFLWGKSRPRARVVLRSAASVSEPGSGRRS